MKYTAITHRFNAIGRHQRGASLLEGIAYLGIAAIVILGAISLLTGAFSSAQANRLAEEVLSIRTGVKKLYMGQSNTYGAAAAAPLNLLVANAGVFPATVAVIPATGAATNAWGGAVTVTGQIATFDLTYTAVPRDICILALSGASGWLNIGAGAAGATAVVGPPLTAVTPANADAACVAGANTIIWSSR
ncbi:MAG: hypothetical protein ACI9ZF_002559 [Bradyrhizobium sp.]|jgi:hypothetical protein